MVKTVFKSMLGLALVVVALGIARAEDKKEGKKEDKAVTLKGEIGCPKCVFGVAKACANAIKVKDTIYLLVDKGAKESYHKTICTEGKPGTVTGVVSKKDKKDYIKPGKDGVKFD